jgi:hypothetical protein
LPLLAGRAGALVTAGRAGRATAPVRGDFFELVVRFSEVFLEDFPARAFFPEADLFLVTFFPMSFRLDDVLPDCLALFLPVFPFADGFFEVAFLEAAFFFGIR